MKKHNFFFAILLTIGISVFATTTAKAEEIDHEVSDQNTSVGVKITEPNLWLLEVSDLHFGKFAATNQIREVTAENNLEIKIKENRTVGSQWKLFLSIATFENQQKRTVSTANIDLATGTSKTSGSEEIVGNKIILRSGKPAEIGEQRGRTGPSQITYTIPKDQIWLTIPANLPPGKYQAALDYVLTDAP